ncbi:hypothetical protein ACKI14_48730, partial [Streptomyces turgidiscabies]|uniref:hypothetical protein n=1 Tax=Streptomyces turgidiscabies TaxID=85558 RepID=UPI0038F6C194
EFAAHRLQENRSARADRLYCLVFSDMYVDDATTPAGVIHYRPLASADWGLLKGISTSFYFVAPANHDAIVGIGARNGLNFTVFEPREVTGAD